MAGGQADPREREDRAGPSEEEAAAQEKTGRAYA